MVRYGIVSILTCCVVSSVVTKSTQDQFQRQVDDDEYVPLIHSGVNNDFDFQLLRELSKSNNGNTIISPISLKLILALLYEGSSGITENELQSVLKFANKTTVLQEYAKTILKLKNNNRISCESATGTKAGSRNVKQQNRNVNKISPDLYTLNLGTRIYLDKHLNLLQPFESKACESYQTKVVKTNFEHADVTAGHINDFVNRTTLGKLSKLVNPEEISNAVMILVNALYFRGFWTHQFPRDKSHTGGFYLEPGKTVQVPYMATTDNYFYADSEYLDSRIIRIPFQGKKFAMIVMLPNSKAGLETLVERLDVQRLHSDLSQMTKSSVDLVLPKFMFDYQAKLSETLKHMGLRSMFENTASLPGIARGSTFSLQVSDIIQKAGIEVNEEGSTAFAASDIQLTNKFGDAQIMFNVTHPFLFYIEDQQARTILFLGKVTNPVDGVVTTALPTRYGDNENIPTPQVQSTPSYLDGLIAHYTPPQQTPPAPPAPQAPHDQYGGVDGNGVISVLPLSRPTRPSSSFVPSGIPAQTTERYNGGSEAERFTFLDFELLQSLAAKSGPTENLFISPASIKATLGMILEGARGNSANEIAHALRINVNQQYNRNVLNQLLYDLSDENAYTKLFSTNAIFVSDKLTVHNEFKNNIEKFYKAQISPLNFNNVDQSVYTINQWVFQATRGLIPSIIAADSINRDTSAIVTNAIYFKSQWKFAFDPTLTTVKCFYLSNGQCHQAEMMQNTAEARYKFVEKLNAHALELPYGDGYAMLVLIPSERTTVSTLFLRDIQHDTIDRIIATLEKSEVTYEIPKFDIVNNVPLREVLEKSDVREIFGGNANLTGMVQNTNVKVDNIVHQAKIEVNEQGTVAAAATAAVVIPLMGSSSPHIMANHPFVFLIYKTSNRNILFAGVVNKPNEARGQQQQQQAPPVPRVQHERNLRLRIGQRQQPQPTRQDYYSNPPVY